MDPSNPITQVYQDEDGTPHNIGFPKNGAGDREPTKKTKKKRRRKTCCSFQWRSLLCCVPSRCSKKNNCCNETVEAPVQKSAEESDGYSANVQDSTSAARFLLPPLKANDEKKCLIIDLDETLVHSSFKPISNADFVVPVEIDGVVHQVYVLKRPHVDEFLQSVGKIYECVLFTASLAKYADPVADLLDKWDVFSSRLFREACVFHRGNYVKDLGRLGRDLDRVVIIDNSPASYIFHPENAVPVASWFDDMSDTELLDLIPYLENLSQAKDIYAYLRTNPHPLSCKRSSDREPAGGGSSDASSSSSACSPVPGTSQSAGIITSVEKPGTSRRHPLVVSAGSVASPASEPSGSSASAMNSAGDGDNCIQQLSNAVGRLALHESSNALTRATPMADMNRYDSTSFTKTGDGLPASASGNDYSFNVMVSNGNGSPSGASGDAHLFNTSAGSVKTP